MGQLAKDDGAFALRRGPRGGRAGFAFSILLEIGTPSGPSVSMRTGPRTHMRSGNAESEKPQRPGEMGQTESDGKDGDRRHALSRIPSPE